jgi:putative transposase
MRALQFYQEKGISERRSCFLLKLGRSSARYVKNEKVIDPILSKIENLREKNPRFGSRRLHALLRKEGEEVNHKRVERLVQENHLQVPKKKRYKVPQDKKKPPAIVPERQNHVWTLDFQEDALASGRKVKILNILDEFTRTWLFAEASFSSSAEWVRDTLSTLFRVHGVPEYLRSDNGSEFIAHLVKVFLLEQGCSSAYIDKGKPWQNGIVESFHGKVRDEFLNRESFSSLPELNGSLQSHRHWYNEERPHSSLGYQTPLAFGTSCSRQENPPKSENPHQENLHQGSQGF